MKPKSAAKLSPKTTRPAAESAPVIAAGNFPGERPLRVELLIETSSSWGSQIIKGISDWMSKSTGPGVGRAWSVHVDFRGYYESSSLPEGWNGDGIIARITNENIAQQIRATGRPCVNVSQFQIFNEGVQRVSTDETQAGRLAAETLLATGMEHFAYVSTYRREGYVDRIRQEFESRIHSAGHGPVHVFESKLTSAGIRSHDAIEALADWLRTLPQPVGLVAWNTLGAHRVIEACAWAGLKVPQQVSVLAAEEDALISSIANPPITSIDIAPRRVGYLAAAELSRLMQHPVIGPPLEVPPAGVIWRQSVLSGRTDDALVSQAMQYMEQNLREVIGLDQISEALCVSRRTLELRFRATLGRGPAAHLQQLRLHAAQKLLAETNLLIKQISMQCGFRSSEHFQRVLRNETGLSPRQYRDLHRRPTAT